METGCCDLCVPYIIHLGDPNATRQPMFSTHETLSSMGTKTVRSVRLLYQLVAIVYFRVKYFARFLSAKVTER